MIHEIPKKFILVLFGIWLSGCSSYAQAPLTQSHPAHPEAVSGRADQPSITLAYASLDPFPLNPVMAAAQEKSGPTDGTPGAAGKLANGEGRVVAVVPGSSQLVVDHDVIKGFMDAMTMGYQTEPKSLLEGIKAGDKVRFSIDVDKKAIVKLEKLP